VGWKWAAHMAGIVTLMDAVLVGAVGVLSRRPLGVPWRPQALRKPSCQGARGTFLSGGQSECSRTTFIHGKSCGKEQCCRADWARHMQLSLPVRYSGLLYVVRIAFRRVVECGSANCA